MISTNSLRTPVAVLCALAALTGCKIQKPSTEVPAAPTIESFTASSARVASGDTVTLSWSASNATAVELRETSEGPLDVSADAVTGTFEVRIERASLFVLVVRGPGGSDARAVSVALEKGSVGDISFQAIPPSINGGSSSTLAWTALGAEAVSITANGQAIDLRGQRSTGAVTVSPAFDTTYTLTADGSTRTAQVTVSPVIFSAELDPPAAEVGQSVTVKWTAAGGDRLTLSSPGRGQLFETSTAAEILSGSFVDTVPPTASNGVVTYDLTVHHGADQHTRRLELNVGVGVAITRFEAPAVSAQNAPYTVRWQTSGADQVELLVDGVTVHRTATASAAANGVFLFTSPAGDFAVEIIASNRLGGRATQLAQVDAVGVPASVTLMADPQQVTVGQPVTLTYASLEARRVRITNTEGETVFSTTGQTAEGGTVMVYPTTATTYTISADNQLGSMPVTGTASIIVTGAPLAITQHPPTAISGQVVSLESAAPGALFYGFPHGDVLRASQADFIDISLTGTRVLEETANVVSVDLPFSTTLWGRRYSGPLTISRAGWMAWGAPLTVINSNPTSLPSSSSPEAVLAPFWDDLTLVAGTSAVLVQLVGNAPDERLVVQWNRMRVGTTASTEATFQVQVHQRGTVSYQYRTMTLGTSPSFVIGHQGPGRQVFSSSTEVPASNSARYFFSPVAPPVDVRLFKDQRWGGYVKVGEVFTPVLDGGFSIDLPTDLSVTELMFRPAEALPNGQFVEVLNRTNAPLDLTGWQMRATGTPTFEVPANFVLQPGVPTVIGASTDGAENDDAGAVLAWGPSGFSLSRDAGTVTFGTADAGASISYAGPADGGLGSSLQLDPGPYQGTSTTMSAMQCASTTPFGTQSPQQLGNPGALGSCFPYAIVSIPVHFVDVSDGGTQLINSPTSAVDSRTVTIALASDAGTDPAPFTFGERRPVVSMSIDGWMTYGSTTTTDHTNDTTTGAAPVGKLAVFWDDLHTTPNRTPVSDLFWKQIGPGEDPLTPARHWVFQWSHVRHYATSPADDLNFEIKLFEDGVIEYHYGEMASGTTSAYGDGNSSTIWLELPNGSWANVIGINVPVLRPNTAYRFVPR